MSVNFLTADRVARYCFLDDADRDFLRPLRQAGTRRGSAVQLGTWFDRE